MDPIKAALDLATIALKKTNEIEVVTKRFDEIIRNKERINLVKGEKGDRGDEGSEGLKGDKGDKGDKGERGERGIQGIQGIQGEKGDRGESGKTPPPLEWMVDKTILLFKEPDGSWKKALDLRNLRKGGGNFNLIIDSNGSLVSKSVDEINFVGFTVTTNTDSRGFRKVNVSGGGGSLPALPLNNIYLGDVLNNPVPAVAEQWILLEEFSPFNDLDVIIDDVFASPYDEFKVEIRELIPTVDDSSLNMQWSPDNGSSFYNSLYREVGQTASQGTNIAFADYEDSSTNIEILEGCGNDAGEHVMTTLYFFSMLNTNLKTICRYESAYITSGNEIHSVEGTATNITGNFINALRFYFSSSNISSGSIKVYGKIN